MFGKRKYEFKPDRGEGTLKKLYLTPIQRKRLLKWGAVSLVLVVLSLLQDVVLCRIQISGSTFDMAVCGILLCGMFFNKRGVCTIWDRRFWALGFWTLCFIGKSCIAEWNKRSAGCNVQWM